MTGPARFPDVVRCLAELIPSAVAGVVGAGPTTPPDLQQHLPWVRVLRVGGGSDPVTDYPLLDVDVFAATYNDGEHLAETLRQWLCGPPPPHPRLDSVDCDSGPTQRPWDDPNVRRFGAIYAVTCRRRGHL